MSSKNTHIIAAYDITQNKTIRHSVNSATKRALTADHTAATKRVRRRRNRVKNTAKFIFAAAGIKEQLLVNEPTGALMSVVVLNVTAAQLKTVPNGGCLKFWAPYCQKWIHCIRYGDKVSFVTKTGYSVFISAAKAGGKTPNWFLGERALVRLKCMCFCSLFVRVLWLSVLLWFCVCLFC